MNIIITYLDTMFASYPSSPKMQEAKAELQAMMEDAYQGLLADGVSHNEAVGKVITDFGNLDELAPVLGITGEIEPPTPSSADSPSTSPATKTPRHHNARSTCLRRDSAGNSVATLNRSGPLRALTDPTFSELDRGPGA